MQDLNLYYANLPYAHNMLKLGFFNHTVQAFMVLNYGRIIALNHSKRSKLHIRMPIDVYLAIAKGVVQVKCRCRTIL